MKINVAFLFGGNSTEHEISVISAVQAMTNVDKNKYHVIPIYLAKDNTMYYSESLFNMESYKDLKTLVKNSTPVILTKKNNEFVIIKNKFPYNVIKKIDIAFPVMHGYNTEDGAIAGYLEVMGIPYCESDIYADVVGQDKVFQKAVLKANNINVVDYIYFYENDYARDPKKVLKDINTLGYPVIVKPARQGSSVGITVVKSSKDIASAIENAIMYDDKILIEKLVNNLKEVNCSVLGNNGSYEASAIEEVYGSKDLLSYEDKYMSNGSKKGSKGMASAGRKVPADLSNAMQKAIEQMSIDACRALNTSGVVRIDYLIDQELDEVYLNEMNITPGSLSFYLWTPKGKEYKELLTNIIDCGIKKYQNKAKKVTSFDTNVLASFKGTKGVKK